MVSIKWPWVEIFCTYQDENVHGQETDLKSGTPLTEIGPLGSYSGTLRLAYFFWFLSSDSHYP